MQAETPKYGLIAFLTTLFTSAQNLLFCCGKVFHEHKVFDLVEVPNVRYIILTAMRTCICSLLIVQQSYSRIRTSVVIHVHVCRS